MKIEFYHIDAFEVPIYEPIWRKLKAKGIEAKLVGVPGNENTASAGWFDFERFQSYCKEQAIPFNTTPDPTANLAVTTQNIDILRNYSCPKVRIMYGPILYPKAWGLQSHTAQPFDGVLTHSNLYADYFSTWLPRERLPVVGYPRYDDFFSGKLRRDLIRKRWGVNDSKPVLVFMPTWGDNTGFDIFFPALLQLAHRYQIILRPHHCTLRLEPNRMAMLQASGLLILDKAFDLAELYAGADAVIADVRSGGLFESVVCEVPTVGMVIDANEICGWLAQSRVGEIVSLCDRPQQLAAAIDLALTSKTQAECRRTWAESHVAHRDGTAADHAADALIKLAMLKAHATKPIPETKSSYLSGLFLMPVSQTNLEKN